MLKTRVCVCKRFWTKPVSLLAIVDVFTALTEVRPRSLGCGRPTWPKPLSRIVCRSHVSQGVGERRFETALDWYDGDKLKSIE